ncbi:trichohyalin-like [Ptychodera flava]|uniref:trichohyalin-like n=1 Tax=Ptychodera flava TaxID=63121 RepID=UPI003969F0AF
MSSSDSYDDSVRDSEYIPSSSESQSDDELPRQSTIINPRAGQSSLSGKKAKESKVRSSVCSVAGPSSLSGKKAKESKVRSSVCSVAGPSGSSSSKAAKQTKVVRSLKKKGGKGKRNQRKKMKCSYTGCTAQVYNLKRHFEQYHDLSLTEAKDRMAEYKSGRAERALRSGGEDRIYKNCPIGNCPAKVKRLDRHITQVHGIAQGSQEFRNILFSMAKYNKKKGQMRRWDATRGGAIDDSDNDTERAGPRAEGQIRRREVSRGRIVAGNDNNTQREHQSGGTGAEGNVRGRKRQREERVKKGRRGSREGQGKRQRESSVGKRPLASAQKEKEKEREMEEREMEERAKRAIETEETRKELREKKAREIEKRGREERVEMLSPLKFQKQRLDLTSQFRKWCKSIDGGLRTPKAALQHASQVSLMLKHLGSVRLLDDRVQMRENLEKQLGKESARVTAQARKLRLAIANTEEKKKQAVKETRAATDEALDEAVSISTDIIPPSLSPRTCSPKLAFSFAKKSNMEKAQTTEEGEQTAKENTIEKAQTTEEGEQTAKENTIKRAETTKEAEPMGAGGGEDTLTQQRSQEDDEVVLFARPSEEPPRLPFDEDQLVESRIVPRRLSDDEESTVSSLFSTSSQGKKHARRSFTEWQVNLLQREFAKEISQGMIRQPVVRERIANNEELREAFKDLGSKQIADRIRVFIRKEKK